MTYLSLFVLANFKLIYGPKKLYKLYEVYEVSSFLRILSSIILMGIKYKI